MKRTIITVAMACILLSGCKENVKKYTTITANQLRELIAEQGVSPNCNVILEDSRYVVKPLEWYSREPILGVEETFYVHEAYDCGKFAATQVAYWLKKDRKGRLEMAGMDHGGFSDSALPAGIVKYIKASGECHICNIVVCSRTDGKPQIEFFDRGGRGWRRIAILPSEKLTIRYIAFF